MLCMKANYKSYVLTSFIIVVSDIFYDKHVMVAGMS